MATFVVALGAVLAVAAALAAAGCKAPANANVLLDVAALSANHLPGLRAPAATLDVLDKNGAHVAVTVHDPSGDPEGADDVVVQSPLPVACDAQGLCSASITTAPGDALRFILDVTAADRCDNRARMMELSSAPLSLSPYEGTSVDLTLDDASYDDDGDGVANVLEAATCGRFDVDDGPFAPQRCAPTADGKDDPCCAGKSHLEGRMTAFAGGAFSLADGTVVDVAPFALDDSEVTWRQFARCVAMGKCLAGNPQHPLRQQIGAFADELPMQGMSPSQAQELCAAYGKRLPLDVEWDFAAAHRDGAPASFRAKFPFDDDVRAKIVDATGRRFGVNPNAGSIGCQPDDDGIAANHAIAGVACPLAPLPVGSYGSSWARRGHGEPLADLAGNVAEWTLVEGDAPDVDEMPHGFSAAVLRGGGALSAEPFLENDLPIVAKFPSSQSTAQWSASLRRLAIEAGFRCAASVDDGSVPVPFTDEPTCH